MLPKYCPNCSGILVYTGNVAKCEFVCRKVWDWDRDIREREAEDRRKEAERKRQAELMVLGDESLSLFESVPEHLSAAEEQLDQAEIDFRDRAFAPFWDCVERAVNGLGRTDEVVRDINHRVSRYTDLARRCDSTPPAFPLAGASIAKLGVGTASAERLKTIVRIAQPSLPICVRQ